MKLKQKVVGLGLLVGEISGEKESLTNNSLGPKNRIASRIQDINRHRLKTKVEHPETTDMWIPVQEQREKSCGKHWLLPQIHK